MTAIVSTYFQMIASPNKGIITAINQITFFASMSQVYGSVLLVHTPQLAPQNIGVGLLKESSLIGTFSLPPPATTTKIARIETSCMISSTSSELRKITNESQVDMLGEFILPSPIELA